MGLVLKQDEQLLLFASLRTKGGKRGYELNVVEREEFRCCKSVVVVVVLEHC